ncbi:hypothetical protein [Amycolatopsis sp. NPDC051371]|uniref:hypothetical protein n=1 Tax=Amycolatopsis sp. NPDC051371 TaxID=3155800 RepID=UPI00341D8F52
MSTSFAFPATRSAMLLRRRIATYFVGGAEQIPALVSALEGHLVHELSVDVKDGVRESGMVCAVLLAAEDTEPLLGRLRELPSVVSAELA